VRRIKYQRQRKKHDGSAHQRHWHQAAAAIDSGMAKKAGVAMQTSSEWLGVNGGESGFEHGGA